MRLDSDGYTYNYGLFDIEYYIEIEEFLRLNLLPQANHSIIDKITNL